MRPLICAICLIVLFGNGLAPSARAAGPFEDADTILLRQAKVGTDDADLLAYLRERSKGDSDLQDIDGLIRQLGGKMFKEREEATAKLIRLGLVALPQLRKARADKDPEVARRAEKCIKQIAQGEHDAAPRAAVRLLLRRHPRGTIETLLRYLPFEVDEKTRQAIWFGIDDLTRSAGAVDPSLLAALKDPLPARRALAACIVGRRGSPKQQEKVRALLADADPDVRLRAAQGLLGAKDKSAIPVLIALLDERSVEVCWQAEELLRWAAGDSAPVGAGLPRPYRGRERQRCKQAWEAWWKERGPKVDLAKRYRSSRRPGLVLLCDRGDPHKPTGRVWLSGCDGTTRWELTNLSYPADARLLPGGRIVIAERPTTAAKKNAPKPRKPEAVPGVSERDLSGKVIWRYQGLKSPIACQPLANGNLFLAERGINFAEVDAQGNEVYLYPLDPVNAPKWTGPARKLDNGRLLCGAPSSPNHGVSGLAERDLANSRLLSHMSFGGYAPRPSDSFSVDVLGGGRFLVSGMRSDGVMEFAPWKLLWKCPIPGSAHAARLANGNTLAGGGGGRLAEVARDGVVVWEKFFATDFQRVYDCLGLVRLGFDSPADNRGPLAPSLRPESLSDKEQRGRAIAYLAKHGGRVPGAVSALTALLKDPDAAIRDDAKQALSAIEASPFVARLNKVRQEKDPAARAEAIYRLPGSCDDRVIAPLLIEALNDENAKVRWAAANRMGSMELEAEKVVPALIKAAQDSDVEVQQVAVSSLMRMGPKAAAAVPVLIECLKSDDGTLRYRSAVALGLIGPVDKRVIPVLTEALKDPRTRCGAAGGLSVIGPQAASAVPALLDAFEAPLKGFPPHVPDILRRIILTTFGRIGPGAKAAVPTMIKVVQDKNGNGQVRMAAVESLGRMGSAAEEAIPVLREVAGNTKDAPLAKSASQALRKIQGNTQDD